MEHLAEKEGFDPNQFLDRLMQHMKVQNDEALAKRLKVSVKIIKNIRSRELPVAASILMCIEDATGISVAELRRWMGDRRTKCRMICNA